MACNKLLIDAFIRFAGSREGNENWEWATNGVMQEIQLNVSSSHCVVFSARMLKQSTTKKTKRTSPFIKLDLFRSYPLQNNNATSPIYTFYRKQTV